ncbi:cadherin-like domain-containing protein [Stenomitos frigidus]|nr:cadherin-like domain-containing protein [Stenomitos frigidus]
MPVDSIGNTLATAKPIFPIASIQTLTEFIGVNAGTLDANDYYSFKLTRASSFTLSLTGLSANADVQILTSAGAIATGTDGSSLSSSNTGTLAESINNILDPGTYYIRVSPGPATDPLNPLTTTPSTNYNLNVVANSNTKTDILWRNYATGENATWVMDGTTLVSGVYLQPIRDLNWKIQATGDFNGDGNTDIVWRNYATGQNAFWLMNGTTLVSSSFLTTIPDSNWQIQGAGDFNSDGSTDLVWRNYATGQNAVWFIKNLTLASSAYIESYPSLSARIETVADFNLDGNPDILWRDYSSTTNNNFIWLMNGTTKAGVAVLPTVNDLNWRVQGAVDLNYDGNSDLLWRNLSTGQNIVWFLKGTTFSSSSDLPITADTNWRATTPFNRPLPAVRADAAGNTTATAFSIGPINGSGVYRDTVSDTIDLNDYYQFSLGSSTQLSLALTGLGGGALNGNLDLQLYNAFGGLVASSANGGNAAESFTVNGLVAGTYYIQVAATAGNSAYELNINANNLPVLLSNNVLTVSEGSASTISNTLLQVTDENNPTTQLTYTLITPPNIAKGALSLNGAAIAQNSIFTQADIDAGKLSYSQNGGETLTDSFVFNVSDGVGGTVGNTTFTINTIPVNDPPTLSINTALTLREGAAASLSSLNLLATDVEQTAAQLIYSLNSLPTSGSLLLNNTAIAAGSTFTQADVSSGTKLSYSHNGTESTNDSFSFTVTDGAGGTVALSPQTFSIVVTPFNDAPVLISNKGLTVTEGSAPIITSALLQTSDAEFTGTAISPQLPDKIIYTVGTLPINGALFVGTNGLTANGTFTQADINNNRILYNHNGSKTNSDSFVFRVSDGTTVTTDSTFNIIVSSVNSPPVLSSNAGLLVNEGATANIGNTLLQVTDPDNPPPQIIYTLGQKPVNGTLKLNGTALTAGQTFSQQDINNLPNSRLTYQHSGSETTSDSFTFTASDPFGAVIPTTTFSIGVTPINDAPTLLSNVGLTLSEGATGSITTTLLSATDVDNLDAQITYTVSTPAHGSLLLGATTVTSLTQADLAGGQLKYVHDGSESTADSFTFTLSDGTATIAARTFNVSVLPVNDLPGLSNNTGLTVAEGATSTIASTALAITDNDGPGPLTYTLGSGTTKGTLKLGTATLAAGQTFTQTDITSNRLSYTHDGSETTADSFTFTASDGSTGTVPLTTFSIAVTPVNDVPVLVSNSAITLLEGALTTISSSVLQVSDGDSPPLTSLVYNVTSGPTNGTLLLSGNAVISFTQANLNSGQLVYQHNGNESLTDSFAFTVTDGVVTTPVGPNVFSIAVTPVNDAPGLSNNLGLTVAEGATSTIASPALAITDNDGPGPLTYTLGTGTTKGTLKLGTATLAAGQTFTQTDITSNRLSYVHDGSETTADSFTFTASDGSTGTLPLTTFNIAVTPVNDAPVLISNSGITLLEGALTTINSSVLQVSDGDSPPLTNLVYSVTTDPTNGALLLAGNPVTSFTQANLNSGQLVYQHNGNESLSDSFAFTVTDGVVTTPVGPSVFNIAVTPVNDAPGLSNNLGLTLAEGATSTIASTALAITDNDGPGPLTYTLGSGTTKGTLKLGTATLVAGQTFTQADIASSRLSYTHDGSETTADSFSFTASDSSTGTIALTTFSINVTPVNDAPVLTVPGFQAIDEDLPLAFTGTKLVSVSDADIGGNPLVVTLSASGGTLSLNPGSLTVNNNATSLVTLTGQLTAVNNALSSLVYKGLSNFNGPDTISIAVTDQGSTGAGGAKTDTKTIDLIVNPINDAPTLTVPGAQTVLEDTALSLAGLIDTTDVDSGTNPVKVNLGTLNGKLTLGTTGGLTFADNTTNGDGSLSFTGAIGNVRAALATLSYQGLADYFGTDTITIKVDDQGAVGASGALSIQKTIAVNVTPVNDAPSFTAGTNLVVNEDAAPQTVNWATGIATGPANEASQTLNFITANNNASLFTTAPTIDPTGKLTYTLAPNANGVATVTVNLKDNGGTANSGNDTSPASTFTITANPVNDTPSFTKGANQTITEDAGAQTVAGWATAITAGPADEAAQTLSVLVNTDNPSLFSVAPTIDPTTGTLTYTAAPNVNGTAIVTVQLKDNGGTALGGVDSSALQTFTINVTAVNDAPVFTLPSPPTVSEDTTLPITGLSLADIDAGSSSLVVTLAVSNGTLKLGNTAGLTITAGADNTSSVAFRGNLSDINAALSGLSYRGNPNFNGADTLTLTANDQGATGSGAIGLDSKALAITVTAVNDAPVITVPGSQTVDEDTNLLLSGINVTDADSNPNPITVTLSATNGTLTLDPLVAGSATLTITDTLNNINTAIANLTYKGNLNYNGADTITIQANDQGNTGFGGSLFDIKTISVNVNAVNDAPTLTVPGAQTVSEDTNLVFNAGKAIILNDVDSGPNPIQVNFAVSNGTLTLGAVGSGGALTGNGTGTVNYIGTLAALTPVLNTLTYRGKQDYSGADTLNITVNDQGNTGSGSPGIVTGSVALTVSAVNDSPVLVTNRTLTLSEGTSSVITNSQLRTTDVDNTPDLLVYTLFSAPNPLTSGSLRLSNGGGTTATLAAGGTFTQADVNSGYLSYLQNGSETTSDSFTFKVFDNTPGSITIPGSGNATFNIVINPVNDAPAIVNNAKLNLSEGATSTISNTLLSVSDADNTTVQLKYTLSSAPNNGNLRLNGAALSLSQTFTQDDINSNRISYRHNGSETTSDSFIFTVNDGAGGTTGSKTFNIGIANVNDAPTIVASGPATVNEGATLNITNTLLKTSDADNLTSELRYTLPTVPIYGTLFLNGVALAANAIVTQQQIDQGGLTYVHNGSEPSGNDVFVFQVSDGTTTISSRVFNININPVNDAPVLASNTGLLLAGNTPSLTVIGSDLLQVTDVDNTTAQLTYTLTSVPNPTVGALRLNGRQISAGQSFTQADIDSGNVSFDYLGNGSGETFQFTVSDGGVGGTLSNAFFYINFSYS